MGRLLVEEAEAGDDRGVEGSRGRRLGAGWERELAKVTFQVGSWFGGLVPRKGGRGPSAAFSLAIGYRWSGVGEIYVTPKVGMYWERGHDD